jgi:hypothetical protein
MKSLNGDGHTLGKERKRWCSRCRQIYYSGSITQDKLGKSNVLYTKGADLEIENELEIQNWSS